MNKWKYPKDYIGPDYSDYYVLLSRSRDSDNLENSNFETALKMLGGEKVNDDDLPLVYIARAGHWAVGWVETLLVHESYKEGIEIGNSIEEQLENYPILDDDDFSMREYEETNELCPYVLKEVINKVDNDRYKEGKQEVEFTEEQKAKIESLIFDHLLSNDNQYGREFNNFVEYAKSLIN